MRQVTSQAQSVPLGMVGGCTFGRYPKISLAQTYNMIHSDDGLVPFAGYRLSSSLINGGKGRGAYASNRFNRIIAIVDDTVFSIETSLDARSHIITVPTVIGLLSTSSGDVFIAENNADQIAICDFTHIYIYNYGDNTFSIASINFQPGYIEFQDGYFISIDVNQAKWRLSDPNQGLSWPDDANHVGLLQTKPDKLIAAVRFPGKGNLLLVIGKTVVEPWYDIGSQLFPYQRSNYNNIDYGCINAATIAANDEMVVWLAQNEKSGPVIAVSDGADIKPLSTDGINYQLSNITYPDQSFASLFKQDGHLIYMITFYNPVDNFTIIYDFNTEEFFYLTDDKRNCHIAKKIVFLNNNYFFVAHNDGNLYLMDSDFYDGNGKDIPRIRVLENFRLPDGNPFAIQNITFTLEQGASHFSSLDPNFNPHLQRIDLSISKDGGQKFSNVLSKQLNYSGVRPNRLNYFRLGRANDLICQFRFWGQGRFVVLDGLMSYYQ